MSFDALDISTFTWRWRNLVLEERWWIGLSGVSSNRLLLTSYVNENNPDKKALLALDANTARLIWWKNNFAISAIYGNVIEGIDSTFSQKKIILRVDDGVEIGSAELLDVAQNFDTVRPFHYQEGTSYFDTVKSFLTSRTGLMIRSSVEYCEYKGLIIISAFVSEQVLANYLFVFTTTGDLVLKETLGDDLAGIATETFFLYAGCLIFVKNKRELVSYKVYD